MCALHMHHRIAAAYRAVDSPNDNDDDDGDDETFLNSRIFVYRAMLKGRNFAKCFKNYSWIILSLSHG